MRNCHIACIAVFATFVGCTSTGFETTDYDYNYDSPTASDAQPASFVEPAALPVAAEPPTAIAATVVHIKAGDTLYSLSTQHLGTPRRWRDIAALNGLGPAQVRNLSIGQAIKLPPR